MARNTGHHYVLNFILHSSKLMLYSHKFFISLFRPPVRRRDPVKLLNPFVVNSFPAEISFVCLFVWLSGRTMGQSIEVWTASPHQIMCQLTQIGAIRHTSSKKGWPQSTRVLLLYSKFSFPPAHSSSKSIPPAGQPQGEYRRQDPQHTCASPRLL